MLSASANIPRRALGLLAILAAATLVSRRLRRKEPAFSQGAADKRFYAEMDEKTLDHMIADSFPASDPAGTY